MATSPPKLSRFPSIDPVTPRPLHTRTSLDKFHLNHGLLSKVADSLIAATSSARRNHLLPLRRRSHLLPLLQGSNPPHRDHHHPWLVLPPVANDAASPNRLLSRHPNASAPHRVLALSLATTMSPHPRMLLRLTRPTTHPLHRIFARPRPRSSRGLDGHNCVSSHQCTLQGTKPDQKCGSFCVNWFP